MSKVPMIAKLLSRRRMPPTRPASNSPPNILPLTWTAIESMAMIGNLPWANRAGAILTPWIDPLNSSPDMPLIPVTVADSVRTKSSGAFWMSTHWMPSASMRTGRNDGHWNESPVADPTERNTPKPCSASKVPSPRIAKLRPSPPMTSAPMVTFAPIEPNCTIRSEVPAAPVSRRKSRAVSVTKVPRRTSRVSMLIWKAWTLPAAKVTAIRNASVSAVPSGRRSSAVSRSEIVAPKAPLGKSLAPPEAM